MVLAALLLCLSAAAGVWAAAEEVRIDWGAAHLCDSPGFREDLDGFGCRSDDSIFDRKLVDGDLVPLAYGGPNLLYDGTLEKCREALAIGTDGETGLHLGEQFLRPSTSGLGFATYNKESGACFLYVETRCDYVRENSDDVTLSFCVDSSGGIVLDEVARVNDFSTPESCPGEVEAPGFLTRQKGVVCRNSKLAYSRKLAEGTRYFVSRKSGGEWESFDGTWKRCKKIMKLAATGRVNIESDETGVVWATFNREAKACYIFSDQDEKCDFLVKTPAKAYTAAYCTARWSVVVDNRRLCPPASTTPGLQPAFDGWGYRADGIDDVKDADLLPGDSVLYVNTEDGQTVNVPYDGTLDGCQEVLAGTMAGAVENIPNAGPRPGFATFNKKRRQCSIYTHEPAYNLRRRKKEIATHYCPDIEPGNCEAGLGATQYGWQCTASPDLAFYSENGRSLSGCIGRAERWFPHGNFFVSWTADCQTVLYDEDDLQDVCEDEVCRLFLADSCEPQKISDQDSNEDFYESGSDTDSALTFHCGTP